MHGKEDFMSPLIYAGLPKFKRISFILGFKETHKNIDAITSHICQALGLNQELLKSPLRKREYTVGRMIAIGISVHTLDLKLVQIGKFFNRDHSTIIYNRDLFNDLLSINDKELIEKLKICGYENLIQG